MHTISALLLAGRAEAPALSAPGRPPLSYRDLRVQVTNTTAALNALGVGHEDRVALVLPNGPELASAFVAVAAGAAAAPLNPALGEEEFRFMLSDLGARALVVERGSDSPAIVAARGLGVPVLELAWRMKEPSGQFTLSGDSAGPPKRDGASGRDATALVLHTSGTTARPKKVPLLQRNLVASAGHVVDTLRLTPEDRCLNVMPLFHIHGLVAAVLSSLAAGASVHCAPGLDALRFFRWMREARPTWYTAVPTMHHAILRQAALAADRSVLDEVRLRFLRSSSAPLAPRLMQELEQTFTAPVIESYGMTEAAHQMASNPLPPAARRPGTVGVAAGPEIAVMDAGGALLPRGARGEVVIRGPNVFRGYEGDPGANAAAFVHGWFRTGDEGLLDDAGYLTITGRLKEIINRGGQKVSPREVDEALVDHPDVAGAATFPIPHPTLGEEIGAAVVPRAGTTPRGEAIVRFLSNRLAEYKVPRRIVFVDEIPKGPTGKVQRHELAAMLGLGTGSESRRTVRRPDERPPSRLEASLRELWRSVLRTHEIGLDDNFFLLGGDSLQAVELLRLVERMLGHRLPQATLIEHGTIAGMAACIEQHAPLACLVPIQPKGPKPPFCCVHHVEGEVMPLRNLAVHLGSEQPFYGIQSVGLDYRQTPHTRIEDMAAHYLREIRALQPQGPYYLGGYSMGGIVAFEMTRQLQAQGEEVALLALLDTHAGPQRMRVDARQWLQRQRARLAALRPEDLGGYLAERLRNWTRFAASRARSALLRAKWRVGGGPARSTSPEMHRRSVEEANERALWAYQLRPCQCDAVLFKGTPGTWDHPDMHERWKTLILGHLEIRTIAGAHANILGEPHVRSLATELADCLEHRQARARARADRERK